MKKKAGEGRKKEREISLINLSCVVASDSFSIKRKFSFSLSIAWNEKYSLVRFN
jgi:hypothetical protein